MQWLDMLAWIGASISLWGTLKYMLSIGRGGTQPRLASWIAWGTANGVLMYVALLNDLYTAALFNGIAAIGNIAVLTISAVRRAGQRPAGATDWTCLAVSGVCLATILCFPRMATMDAILAMCANVIATWPTIQHAWRRPQEEAWQLFAANGGANALGLAGVFASAGAGLSNIAGPLISMIGNVSLVLITVGRSWVSRTVHTVEDVVEEAVEEVAEDVELVREVFVEPLATADEQTVQPVSGKRKLIRTY